MTARQPWGDAAKGVLIVLVVFWHVVLKTYLDVDWRFSAPIPGAWGLASDLVWPFLMPLFLLVSGYFAADALARPWAAVWRPRILRFLYLYLLWTLIHTAVLWAFPEFPTLVPRGVAEFVEALTISPPNTWYLYALALYFVIAKVTRRLPAWIPIGAAAVLSVVVSAGWVETAGNRSSVLADLVFFLVGAHAAPALRRFTARPRAGVAAVLLAAYLGAFALMRATGTEQVPGVWPVVSVLGVALGLAVAPLIPAFGAVGRAATRLGAHTLPIYVIHMPVLAALDAVVVPALSSARIAVQLVAAVALPVVLTAAVTAISALLGRLLTRDRIPGLFDLPTGLRPRVPWRSAVAVLVVVAVGAVGVRSTALPPAPGDVPSQAATRPGEVSIGAVGDILLYDVDRGVPDDRGVGYFDDVRSWFTDDLVTGNLEQAITDEVGYDKCGGSEDCVTFRSHPDAVAALDGFDLLNLANNHSRDYGQAGYDDTRALLGEVGIRTVGDRNEIAYARIGEVVVAVVGFAPYDAFNRVTDLRQVRRIVREAAAHADLVVVHAHLGAEGPDADVVRPGVETIYGENRGDPIAFAHAAVDAGADLVIGHGPHVLRGMEFYRGRLIAYSLGNFGGGGVFGVEPQYRVGAYLSVRLSADGTFLAGEVRSVRFDDEQGEPVRDPEHTAARQIGERGMRDLPETVAVVDDEGTIAPPR